MVEEQLPGGGRGGGHHHNNSRRRRRLLGWQVVGWVGLVGAAVLLRGASAALEPIKELGCEKGKCYVLHSRRVTWEQAQALCRENRTGQLAVIPDQGTQSSLNLMIRYASIYTQVWVGARNRGSTWRWLDGTPYHGEIDAAENEPLADCGYLHTDYQPRVAAADCMRQKKYLCAEVGGSVLQVLSSPAPQSWYEAKEDCAERRKILPMFSMREVQEISNRLIQNTGPDTYWIGLCRQGWIWEGISQEATFLNFDRTVPYCTENKCLSVDYRGVWYNKNCLSRRGFICEIKNQPDGVIPQDVSGSTTLGPNSADKQDNHHDHHDHEDEHGHGLLIGIIVGLAVVITALIVMLVLLITRRKKATNHDENKSVRGRDEQLDNIYAEIREPALPPPPPPSSATTANYYDTPGDNGGGRELTTFKNGGKRLSSIPDYDALGPPPPPSSGPASSLTARVGPATGPYAVSYIACGPKDRSATLDSVAALPIAPSAPPIDDTLRQLPDGKRRKRRPSEEEGEERDGLGEEEEEEEDHRYLLPKDGHTGSSGGGGAGSKGKPIPPARKGILRPAPPAPVKNSEARTSAHGHGEKSGSVRVGTDREAASLMLEENDLYSEAAS